MRFNRLKISKMTTTPSILGAISREQFLAEYWQKKPLLVRNAIANFEPPIDANELAGMALEEEVESRIVIEQDWQLQCGPFSEETFAKLPAEKWTLLVQAVDLWVPEVAEILSKFDFLPKWRIDDIMVSYAADGGSVGPHFDYYDVFLLQGAGKRRWQIGGPCDADCPLVANTELKILQDFDAVDEWVLEPGDMLYLPPKIAHHGVAIGECTTFSVGFRAPAVSEMLDDLATELLSGVALPNHLTDPPLTPAMANEQISAAHLASVRKLLKDTLDDEKILGEWFAQYMTMPKYPDLVGMTEETRHAVLEHGSSFTNGHKD
jgi:50S ribosomal protein L16 3-hydroxylase